jgi:hypothetical protein
MVRYLPDLPRPRNLYRFLLTLLTYFGLSSIPSSSSLVTGCFEVKCSTASGRIKSFHFVPFTMTPSNPPYTDTPAHSFNISQIDLKLSKNVRLNFKPFKSSSGCQSPYGSIITRACGSQRLCFRKTGHPSADAQGFAFLSVCLLSIFLFRRRYYFRV